MIIENMGSSEQLLQRPFRQMIFFIMDASMLDPVVA